MSLLQYFSLSISLLISVGLHSQQLDSTFGIFNSAYEKQVLTSEKLDPLALLMATSESSSADKLDKVRESLQPFFNKLEQEISGSSQSKKINKIHQSIHQTFLSKYELISPFNRIFESGRYNCVSATALFALTMEEFGIPYHIQELPTHVYIIAYPYTKGITVEMTAPKDGLYMPTKRDISKTLKSLVENNLISQSEIDKLGEREVYNSIFYTEKVISLQELAGLQYYNEAIVAIENEKTEDAFDLICKSELLYTSNKTTYFKTEILISLLEDSDLSSMKEIYYLSVFANLNGVNGDKVIYEYANMIEDQLMNNGRKKFVDSTYTFLSENIIDTIVSKKISALYFIGMSDYYNSAYNMSKRLEFARKAYDVNPSNIRTRTWLVKSILAKEYDNKDGEDLVIVLDSYVNQLPFLGNHNYFLKYYFHACADASYDYFMDNDGEIGESFFNLAIETRGRLEDPDVIDQDAMALLYGEKGNYYYRQKQYSKALGILNEGLTYSPNNKNILKRIDFVKSKMN